MKRKWIIPLVAGALAAGGIGTAQAQYRFGDGDGAVRLGRLADWDVGAPEGFCRLRVSVDDKARVEMRGEQIVVRTHSGDRAYDQGSVCNQPLPLARVEDFRVTTERGRGSVFDVSAPTRRNEFTGGLTIDDPQNGPDTYEIVVAWHNPDSSRVAPLASAAPYPWFDETRACQDRVRSDFLARNPGGDAYLEFTALPDRGAVAPNRERIRGEAWARNRNESRPVSYECVVHERNKRVLSASYEVRTVGRYSALY